MPTNYIEVMGKYHPSREVHSSGDGSDYYAIVAVDNAPLPDKTLLDTQAKLLAQDTMWRAIQASRDLRKNSGVKVGTNWFHSDDTSRIQQIGLVIMGANIPPNLMWKSMSGPFVLMTPTLAVQIFQSVAQQDIAIFTAAEVHRYKMNLLDNPSTYDFTIGWPESFTG